MNRREMLLENFKFIFSFLVRSCSPPELEKALGYVQVRINFVFTVYSGSEINFLIRAPTGDQVQIFGRQRANCGRQKFPLPFFKIEV